MIKPPSLTVDARQAAANNALLDLVAGRIGAATDSALARAMRISPPTMSKIRNGHLAIGSVLIVAMIERGGVTIAEVRQHVPLRPPPAWVARARAAADAHCADHQQGLP